MICPFSAYFLVLSQVNDLIMLQQTRGIVLKTFKIRYSQIVSVIYTEEWGRVSFAVSLPKSRKSVSPLSLLQPLALVTFSTDMQRNANLHHFRNLQCFFPYASIPFNPQKTAVALFLQEFLCHAIREEEIPNPPLFGFLEKSLMWLDTVEQSYANFHLAFLLHISSFLGLQPNTDGYVKGASFDMLGASYSSVTSMHTPHSLSTDDSRLLPVLMRMTYYNMHHYRLSRAERTRLLSLMNTYYMLHIPDFPKLESLSVLQDVFD